MLGHVAQLNEFSQHLMWKPGTVRMCFALLRFGKMHLLASSLTPPLQGSRSGRKEPDITLVRRSGICMWPCAQASPPSGTPSHSTAQIYTGCTPSVCLPPTYLPCFRIARMPELHGEQASQALVRLQQAKWGLRYELGGLGLAGEATLLLC
jgi:hypothetical protein